MKQLFLIPPSEGKNPEHIFDTEKLSFSFEKPLTIAKNASEKDLKCSGKRYEEAMELNASIETAKTHTAIHRYTGVMFDALAYEAMSASGKTFFENHFLVLSGLYGILRPLDRIMNYKLPIETKGLYDFWGASITEKLSELQVDEIISFLPQSYAKLVGLSLKPKSQIELRKFFEKTKLIHVDFYRDGKKLSHGVKKVKGAFIKKLCQQGSFDYRNYESEMIDGIIFVKIEV